jgi:hypothetical protein
VKKYLLLIENEGLWESFKKSLSKDINSEIMKLIEERVRKEKKEGKSGK